MAVQLKLSNNTVTNWWAFSPRNSLGLLVCYRAHFSLLETSKIVCVAICLRSNHKMTGLIEILMA